MNNKRFPIRRGAVTAAAGAAALLLAACGSGDGGSAGHTGHSSPSTASAPAQASRGQHNAADVAFAQGMIPHHRQAVEMADLAPDRARSAEVRKLAEDIRKAQGPEIRTLSGWLASWGEEVPSEGVANHSAHDMEGMMTGEEMEQLENASGTAFDTAFMKMMIRHHEGAVKMARAEQADGAYAPARKMAGQIISSQTAEIEKMNELLGKG
ncbi:DUF305 domain-containing protein [Streptomyces sp. Act-28]